jgi:hypothetical protein
MRSFSRLLRLPGPAAEPVEQPLLVPEAGQELDVLHRQIQPVAARVFQEQAFVGGAERGHHLEPHVAPDAVVDVDDEIAGRQRLRLGQEVLGLPLLAGRADQTVAEDVLFGDDGEATAFEAVLQPPDREEDTALAVGHVGPVADRLGAGKPLVLHQPLKAFARAFGIGGDDDMPRLALRLNMRRQAPEKAEGFVLAFDRELAPDAAARVDHAGAGRLRQRHELEHPPVAERRLPRGVVEIEEPRRAGLVDGIDPVLGLHRLEARVVLVLDRLPAGEPRGRHLVVEEDGRAGQVVEQRLEPVVEERQPVLHARMLAPRADRLVERVVGAGRAELDPVVLPEAGDRGLVEDDLGDGGQFHHLELLGRALGRGVEAARAVEHVAEEVEPDRTALARRVDVDDAAAHA